MQFEYMLLKLNNVVELGQSVVVSPGPADVPRELTAGLNKLGSDGWELCGFSATIDMWVFKREKTQQGT